MDKAVLYTLLLLSMFIYKCSPDYYEWSSDDNISVVVTDPEQTRRRIFELIKGTRVSLDIALYGLEDEDLTDLILEASERGVRVRCVTDYDSETQSGWKRISAAEQGGTLKVSVKFVNMEGIMHNKYFVSDGKYVATGSTNFTEKMDTYYNSLVIINSHAVACRFKKDFEILYNGFSGTEKGNDSGLSSERNGYNEIYGAGSVWEESEIKVGKFYVIPYFTPYEACFVSYKKSDPVDYVYYDHEKEKISLSTYGNAMNVVIPLVDTAKKSVLVLAFSFTDKVLIDRLESAVKRGVDVFVILDYSQFVMNLDFCGKDLAALASLSNNLFLCKRPDDGLLHHKVIVIDEKTIILGSLNFSNNAVSSNDENFLVIKNAEKISDIFYSEATRIASYSGTMRLSEEEYVRIAGGVTE